MEERRLRLDFVVAVCALLVSGVAAGASAYQTYVISQQFSATVWPYLSFINTYDRSKNLYELDIRNNGLGPAIIRNVSVTLDGRKVGPGNTGNPIDEAIASAVNEGIAAERRAHRHLTVSTTTSSISTGDVVPAGADVTLIRAAGVDVMPRVLALRPRVDLSICYCSLLGRCWMRGVKDASDVPRDVRRCPDT